MAVNWIIQLVILFNCLMVNKQLYFNSEPEIKPQNDNNIEMDAFTLRPKEIGKKLRVSSYSKI